LDPSIFSGTGTPEPGGLSFSALIEALQTLKGLNIVAADAVELAPHYDQSGVSTAVACKLIREITLLML
jgi:agmatinase